MNSHKRYPEAVSGPSVGSLEWEWHLICSCAEGWATGRLGLSASGKCGTGSGQNPDWDGCLKTNDHYSVRLLDILCHYQFGELIQRANFYDYMVFRFVKL
jgi:hypothetical protein